MRFLGAIRLLGCVFLSLPIAACSSSFAVAPPEIASGADIEDYYESDFARGLVVGATPRDTLTIGMSYVDKRCSNFFDAIGQRDLKLNVVGSTVQSAGNQALTWMAIAKQSALSVAYLAGALEITKVLLEQYRQEFTFKPHTAQLRSLVFQSMNKQREEFDVLTLSDPHFSHILAVASVKRYAENCTLSAILEQRERIFAKAVQEGVSREGDTRKSGVDGFPAPAEGYFGGRRRTRSVLSVGKYVVQ